MRVTVVFEQQFPYRSFLSWDTDASLNPALGIAATVTGHPKKTTTLKNNEHIRTLKAISQTAHLVLPDTQADPSAKPKEPLFSQRTY
jgi:hypothetical protein